MFETRYTLPAILAASAHLALFFSPGPSPLAVTAQPVRATRPPPPAIAIPPEDLPPIEISTKPLEAGTPVPSAPEWPDPNPVRPEFTVDPIYTHPTVPAPVSIIPQRPGLTDGPEGVSGRPHIPSLADLDQVPRPQAQTSPQYPTQLRASGIQGTAVVHFVVNRSGHVVSAQVVSASRPEFGEAAVKAVLHWRFEPGRQQGVPVPFQMIVPIQFSIGDDGA